MVKLKTFTKIFLVFNQRIFRFSIDFFIIFINLIYNLVVYKKPYDDDIVFVTAAEKNYFNQLILLINSYCKHLDNQFIVYDIGLDKEQLQYIKDNYQNLILRKFQFEQYPEFVSQYFDDKLGNYAWKPVIIDEVLKQSKSKVVWLDAGNLITRKIKFLKIALTTNGIIVPSSSNTIKEWTHPKTIEYIGVQNNILKKRNFASGLVGFDYNLKEARIIAELWSEFSQIQECISPKGSSRLNHRQDQAVLTLLLYKYLFKGNFKRLIHPQTNFIFGVLFHNRRIYNF
jgi:hypothetical protein